MSDQLALPLGQGRPCPNCKGKGVLGQRHGPRECPRCQGTGTVPDPATTPLPEGY